MSWREQIRRRSFSSEGRRVVAVVSGSHVLNHMFLVLLPPIFGILAVEFDASLAELGFAMTVLALANTVFQIPFGYLSDNVSRTLTLFLGLALASVGVFVVAVSGSYLELLVGQGITGIGIGAHHPAHYPLLSAATNSENRGWSFSIHDTAGHLGYGAAPALIVSLVAFPGQTWREAYLLLAAVTGGYAVLSLLVLSRSVGDDVTRGGRRSDNPAPTQPPLAKRARTQLAALVHSPAVLALTLFALVVSIAGWGIRSFTVVLMTDGYAYGLTIANSILTVMFAASAVATLGSGLITDRLSATAIIIPTLVFVALATALSGSLLVPPLLAALLIVVGAGAHSMTNPPKNKLLDNLSASGDLGMNFAVLTVGVSLGGSIAPPLFGWLIDHFGFTVAFYLVAACCLVAAGIVVVIVRTYDMSDRTGSVPTAMD